MAIGGGIGFLMAIPFGWRFRTAAGAVLAANLVVLIPYAPVKPAMGQSCSPDIEVVSINAFGDVSDHDELLARVERDQPDVLYVSELLPELSERLQEVYPHHVQNPVNMSALFTKYPVERAENIVSTSGRHPLDATLRTPHGALRVVGAHPPAPGNDAAWHARNDDLIAIASAIEALPHPTVLVGDLNITMFSPHYEPLSEAGMANAREGRGVAATWPDFFPVRIPIDHVLHTSQLKTCDVRVGETFGSDHLPLHVGLKWNPTQTPGRIAVR
jgi:endonuclease/exonuclease/phosphatase (EEP) superfamily protein YafD